jgi:large subunit ribosomal protein L25
MDFYAIDKDAKIKVSIPLHFIGESQAKKEGGAIEINYKEIEVRCLPADLTDFFEVSIEPLVAIGDVIRVSDLKIDTKKYEIMESPDEVVVAAHEIEEMKLEALDPTAAPAAKK